MHTNKLWRADAMTDPKREHRDPEPDEFYERQGEFEDMEQESRLFPSLDQEEFFDDDVLDDEFLHEQDKEEDL